MIYLPNCSDMIHKNEYHSGISGGAVPDADSGTHVHFKFTHYYPISDIAS